MTTIFNTTFEDNHLYQYPVTSGFHALYIDGGTIEVTAASKHSGSYGCEISPLRYYKVCGIQYTEPLKKFRQRFYFNLNTFALADGGYVYLARNHHSDASRIVYNIGLERSGSNYLIYCALADNTETLQYFSGSSALSAGWNYIESYWQSGSPGSFQTWLNGTSIGTLNATNNLNSVIYPALGITHYNSATMSGKFYIDDWEGNNDGSEIGA